ncbi:MAG: PVC-type heme-binding CxxCH protein, partial [Planctomycetota bacterium]
MSSSKRRLYNSLNTATLVALIALLALAPPADLHAQNKNRNKNKKSNDTGVITGAPLAESLVQFMINEKSAPNPKPGQPVATELPLKLNRGEHVVFVGNTLFDYAQDYAYFETMVHAAHPDHELVFRNLSWSADEITLMPRPDQFGTFDQHLAVQGADVIFAAYGFNESFKGEAGLERFRQDLAGYLADIKAKAYNGETGPRIVLVSPIANENVPGVDAATRNNPNIELYTRAMGEIAAQQNVGFVDVFTPTRKAMTAPSKNTNLTFNGIHLEDRGYRLFANALYRGVFGQAPPAHNETLRQAILEKNTQFHYRYRPVNSFYYVGGRPGRYGFVDFLPAMERLDVMILNRDRRIWTAAKGLPLSERIDDSNAPPLPPVTGTRGANKWMSPADELASFEVDPRFEVNCFASEEDFPELACPIQIRWDSHDRLWVSTSQTYPHIYPGNEPNDTIIILEDTDQDGKADKRTVFAEGLHIPLSFEFGDGGVYVSEQPHMTFLKDTDGDGKADVRRKVLTGFGTEDSHHALHDMVWSPDGDMIARDSIFLHSQVETPYGPQRLFNSGWWRYRPSEHKLTTFGMYTSTNPWGVVYDDWGQHQASHPIFASAFHALTPKYPDLNPKPAGLDAYSGTCGADFVDMASFPA